MRLRSGRETSTSTSTSRKTKTNTHKNTNLRKYFDYDSDSESDHDSDSDHKIDEPKTSLPRKPYQTYVLNRIHVFMEMKSKFIGSHSYYIELARAITELYSAMNSHFDDWIYDMYHDYKYSSTAYKILTIVNEKAHTFIQSLMNELTTSTNPLYRKQENIKILHCSLNEMREFVNRVEKYILY